MKVSKNMLIGHRDGLEEILAFLRRSQSAKFSEEARAATESIAREALRLSAMLVGEMTDQLDKVELTIRFS